MGTTQLNFKSIRTVLAGEKFAGAYKKLKSFQTCSKEIDASPQLYKTTNIPGPPCLAIIAKHLVFLCCGIYKNSRVFLVLHTIPIAGRSKHRNR